MENHWTLIKQLVSKILPHISPSCNLPATEEQIELLEKTVGWEMPTSFKEYLRVLNGQNHNNFESNFLGYNCFYSIEEIIKIRETYLFLFEDEPEIDWINENKIQPVIWDTSWIPFAGFNATDHLIIDLNPGKNGVYGQVFTFSSGYEMEDDAIVIANSFEEFGSGVLTRLRSKEYVVEDDIINFTDDWLV